MRRGAGIFAMFEKSFFLKWRALVSWSNVGLQVGHLLLGGVLFMVLWFVLGRTWGAEVFGEFNFLYAYAAIWGIVFDFGLDLPLTRFVSAQGKGIPAALLRIKLFVVLVGFGLSIGLALLLRLSHFGVVMVLLCGVFLLSGTNFVNGLLRGLERLDIEAKIGFLQKVVFVALAVSGVLWFQKGLLWVAGSYFVSHIFGLAVTLFWAARRKYLSLARGSMPFSGRSVMEVIPFWLIALFVTFGQRLDLFMVKGLADASSVGIYSAGFRIIEGFIYIGAAFMTGFFPRLMQALAERNSHVELIRRSAGFLLLASVLIAVVNYFAAPYLVKLLYGPSFIPSILVLQMLGFSLPLLFLSGLLGYALVAFGKERLFVLALIIALLPDFLVDLTTIPKWGVNGAILGFWSREVCLFCVLVTFYWIVQRRKVSDRGGIPVLKAGVQK
jgi:O-antigen/teichoic acid export membrane protein